jgi:hypothetical protein
MEYGETCIPGRMAGLCKLLTVIDVKLFMVHSVATRIKSINQSTNQSKSKSKLSKNKDYKMI